MMMVPTTVILAEGNKQRKTTNFDILIGMSEMRQGEKKTLDALLTVVGKKRRTKNSDKTEDQESSEKTFLQAA